MSKTLDSNSAIARKGLSNLIGGKTLPPQPKQEIEKDSRETEEDPISSGSEEILDSFEDKETIEELKRRRDRRQYKTAGRPRKYDKRTPKEKNYIRRTYMVNEKKTEVLEEIALKETLFLKEIIERAMDLVIDEYNRTGKIGDSK